jgi:hypothetical protein
MKNSKKKKLIRLGVLFAAIGIGYARFRPYSGKSRALSESEKRKMRGVSWLEGCPIPLDDLRMVEVTHKNNLGFGRTGKMVVHKNLSDNVVNIFRELYQINFPIKQIKPIRKFGGNDNLSMPANNSSSFRCSTLEFDSHSRRGTWSEHARGEAIDINPLINPFVTSSGKVIPPEGDRYTDRSKPVTGMVTDQVVEIFRRNGYKWGGNWRSSKDYQHFSIGGR